MFSLMLNSMAPMYFCLYCHALFPNRCRPRKSTIVVVQRSLPPRQITIWSELRNPQTSSLRLTTTSILKLHHRTFLPRTFRTIGNGVRPATVLYAVGTLPRKAVAFTRILVSLAPNHHLPRMVLDLTQRTISSRCTPPEAPIVPSSPATAGLQQMADSLPCQS